MDGTSAAATSVDNHELRVRLPACVSRRAEELLDIALLKLIAICLGVTVAMQAVAFGIAVLSSPVLHYIPEVGR